MKRRLKLGWCLLLALAICTSVKGKSAKEWASKVVYQVLTDRYAQSECQGDNFCGYDRASDGQLSRYCRGTFEGLQRYRSYILGLGVDAIWISPVSKQTDGLTSEFPDGYHGFWTQNFWEINPVFGGAKKLKKMVDIFHKEGAWVMLDVVPNHVGWHRSIAEITPFNKPTDYHDCNGCCDDCSYQACSATPYSNETYDQWIAREMFQEEKCRLGYLRDLNQTEPSVRNQLLRWIRWVQAEFGFDGLRVDAAKHMDDDFNRFMSDGAGTWSIGEFFYLDITGQWEATVNKTKIFAARVNASPAMSSFSFPMYGVMINVFGQMPIDTNRQEPWPMEKLKAMRQLYVDLLPDHVNYLGSFIESHDVDRFAKIQPDKALLMNALAFVLFSEGIPFIYYGVEQGMEVSRDPLWYAGYNNQTDMYLALRTLIGYRKANRVWERDVIDVYAAQYNYVFTRGDVLVSLTNINLWPYLQRARAPKLLTLQLPSSFAGKRLFDVLHPLDSIVVADNGTVEIVPSTKGEPQVFVEDKVFIPPFKSKIRPELEVYGGVVDDKKGKQQTAALVAVLVLSFLLPLLLATYLWSPSAHSTAVAAWRDAEARMRGWRRRRGASKRSMELMAVGAGDMADEELANGQHSPGAQDEADNVALVASAQRSANGEYVHSGSSAGSGGAAMSGVAGMLHRSISGRQGGARQGGGSDHDGSSAGGSLAGDASGAPSVMLEMASGEPQNPENLGTASKLTKLATFGLHSNVDVLPATALFTVPLSPGGGSQHRPSSPDHSPGARSIEQQQQQRSGGGSAVLNVLRRTLSPTTRDLAALRDSAGQDPQSSRPLLESIPERAAPDAAKAPLGAPALRGSTGAIDLASQARSPSLPLPLPELDPPRPGDRVLRRGVSDCGSGGGGDRRASLSGSLPPLPPGPHPAPHGVNANPPLQRQQTLPLSPFEQDYDHVLSGLSDDVLLDPTPVPPATSLMRVSRTGSDRLEDPIPAVSPVLPSTPGGPAGGGGGGAAGLGGSAALASTVGTWAWPTVNACQGDLVLHVAMEYTIPHFEGTEWEKDFTYGGLGKVVDMFVRNWDGALGVCAPLYREAYDADNARAPRFARGPPALSFMADVGRRLSRVDVYTLQYDNVTYFLIQAREFRNRPRKEIYRFWSEHDMLSWLSVFNQSVAVIISQFAIKRVQYHDYHGVLSLMYLHPEDRPMVVYVAHNAHYNGVFSMPDARRRLFIYELFDLSPQRCSRFTEHKGSFDVLHVVVYYIATRQGGVGVVAVSPRYAQQISTKLSVFWQLPSSKVAGVLNALTVTDSLAARRDSLADTLNRKRRAKLELQSAYGLSGGGEYQLMVFLGRLTHQKGVDIIARVAPSLLARFQWLQLVVMGPADDSIGEAACKALQGVAEAYPGRVYCPRNVYVLGPEKERLLQAADWCLCPSRFEPCGLVDIEFGWNGALICGHDTGGLSKMPGVYFVAEASSTAHLAAKLNHCAARALSMEDKDRRKLVQEALERCFPVEEQMAAYRGIWREVDVAAANRRGAGANGQQDAQDEQDEFYEQHWLARARGELMPWQRNRHAFSFYHLMIMQSATLLPSMLILSYSLHLMMLDSTVTVCPVADRSGAVLPWMTGVGVRVFFYIVLSTLCAPLWTLLLFRSTPLEYVRTVVVIQAVVSLATTLAFRYTEALHPVLLLASMTALSGNPLLPIGFIGKENSLSELGTALMSVGEAWRCVLVTLSALLSLLAPDTLTYIVTAGLITISATTATVWYFHPHALPREYRYLRLVAKGQLRMLRGLRCWLIGLGIAALDWAALSLLGMLVLLTLPLGTFLAINAAAFAAVGAAAAATSLALRARLAQLRINTSLLVLLAGPGMYGWMGLAAAYVQPEGGLLAVVSVSALLLGARGGVGGYLVINTLPSREIVAMWQAWAVLLCSMIGASLAAVVYLNSSPTDVPLLLGVIFTVEVARLGLVALMARFFPRENLSAL